MTKLWWFLALGLAPAILVVPRAFVGWLEHGKSAAQVFALRGRTLTFVTAWGIVACAAVVLAFLYDCYAEGLEITGVVCGEFIAVCLWRDYFDNHDFVTQFVNENKGRLYRLLLEGLEMDDVAIEAVFKAVETVIVEFWRSNLLRKAWTELSGRELGEMMFASGIETAKVIVEKKGDDVHWNVAAYMKEWPKSVESVRVPARVKKELRRSCVKAQTLKCIAIIVANETRQVREGRATDSPKTRHPCFATSGMTARKTATEGILNWPNCLSESTEIKILNIFYCTKDLHIFANGKTRPCIKKEIPRCVDYTLKQVIEAGYVRANSNTNISLRVSFEDSYMIFGKDGWNQTMAIKLQPFRYITAAMWMDGNPAFIVKERNDSGGPSECSGSRSLTGVLHVEADVEVEECVEWLEAADIRDDEAGIWGTVEDFVQPKHVIFFNLPALWSIRTAWTAVGLIIRLYESAARWNGRSGHDHSVSSANRTTQGICGAKFAKS